MKEEKGKKILPFSSCYLDALNSMSVIYPMQIEWHTGNQDCFTERQAMIFYRGILQPTNIKKAFRN